MLKRYTKPPFQTLWGDEDSKFIHWFKVELAALEARAELGFLDAKAMRIINESATHCGIDVQRIDEIEQETGHDMVAFVRAMREELRRHGAGDHADRLHEEVTSYDIEDPALILMLRDAVNYIITQFMELEGVLIERAKEHQWTLMIGDTHGQFALPTTFGHLLLVYCEAVRRVIRRLQALLEDELNEGKLSGVVGNYADTNPEIEAAALKLLGLTPALVETQILTRDRHAVVVAQLAVAAGVLDFIALGLWNKMQSVCGELQEPFGRGQKGSSHMPHKKNPILTARVRGMARLVRAAAGVGFENIATPGFREIEQSSAERHIFPDATSQLYYMASVMTSILRGLVVFPERMQENLDRAYGTWASHRVRVALIHAGVDAQEADDYSQEASFQAMRERRHLLTVLTELPLSSNDDRSATEIVPIEKLESLFDPMAYIRDGIEKMFRRALPPDPKVD